MKKLLLLLLLLLPLHTSYSQRLNSTNAVVVSATDPTGNACSSASPNLTYGTGNTRNLYTCQGGVYAVSTGSGSIPSATATVEGKAVLGAKAPVALASLGTCAAGNAGQTKTLTDSDKIPRTCKLTTGSTYAWVRDRNYIDVTDFGAVGDDSFDNTAILDAVMVLAESLALEVYIPTGTYKTTGTINYTAVTSGWGKPPRIYGDGSRKSIIKLYGATNTPVFWIAGAGVAGGTLDLSQGEVRDLGFAQGSGTGNIGLRVQGVSYTVFKGLEASSFTGGTGIEIYASGGSGDSDLVGLCQFRDIVLFSNAIGFGVTSPSGQIAFSQSELTAVYGSSSTTANFLLQNFDGITMTDCLAIGGGVTPNSIDVAYNGIYGRNLTITGAELGNGVTNAMLRLDKVANVQLRRNRFIINNGEAGLYGVEVKTGGDVINFDALHNYFVVGAAITPYTAFQLTGAVNGVIGDQFWGGTFTGSVIKVSDTTKTTYRDNTTVTDTRTSAMFGNLDILAAGAYKYDGTNVIRAQPSLTNFYFANSGNLTASGTSNIAIGPAALNALDTGINNLAIGASAGVAINSGGNNVIVGRQAGTGVTSGTYNTLLGSNARAQADSTGSTVIGGLSGVELSTGAGGNTILGYNTGRGITTGTSNTILGANVTGLSSSLSNNIILADGSGNIRLQFTSTGVGTFNRSLALTNATVTATSGGTTTLDLSLGNIRTITMPAGNTTITCSNVPVGFVTIAIIQDSVGSRTVTWNSLFKFSGAVAPTLTTTANARDQFNFQCDGTNCYLLSAVADLR